MGIARGLLRAVKSRATYIYFDGVRTVAEQQIKSRPLTIAHSHISLLLRSICCVLLRPCFMHIHRLNKLLDQFLMQMRDTSKDSRLIQQVAENPRRGRFTTETQHMS